MTGQFFQIDRRRLELQPFFARSASKSSATEKVGRAVESSESLRGIGGAARISIKGEIIVHIVHIVRKGGKH